ncbi:MAG TPA: hypothetical protein VJ944_01910, partial [Thermoplasmataceae archaeon]|nr:hypothetical protein [Thermoplasmataceae archaeon]
EDISILNAFIDRECMVDACSVTTTEVRHVSKDLEGYIITNDPVKGTYTLYFCKDDFNERAHLYVSYKDEKVIGYLFMFDAIEDNLFWVYTHSDKIAIPSHVKLIPKKHSIITTD